MRSRASALPYGALVPAALALAVFGFTTGSSSVPLFFQEGGKQARWLGLVLLLAIGAAWSLSVGSRRVLLTRRFMPVAALAALAVLSVAWSVDPGVGGARAISLLLLFAATGALAHASAGSMARRRAVAIGLVAGCALVVLGGLLVLLLAPDYAVQWATTQSPVRYRGLGINPNTVPLLLAVCLPLALWAAVEARERRRRVLAWLVVGAFLAQIVASGSRGAALASVLGIVGSALVLDRSRGFRVTASAGVVVLLGYGFVLREVVTPTPQRGAVEPLVVPIVQRPDEEEPTGPGGRAAPEAPGGSDRPSSPGSPGDRPPPASAYPHDRHPPPTASGESDDGVRLFYVRRRDEIGHPLLGASNEGGTLLGGSGRLSVLPEVIRTASRRPLLGYGFGTESQTFTDRWYVFDGGLPENSYLGWVLQLGIVGLCLFLAVGAVLVVVARRALRRDRDGPERRLFAAFTLMALCGFVLAGFQSYVYSVGNVAALPFWVAVFMLLSNDEPVAGKAR